MARQDNKRSSTTSLPIQEKSSPANEEKISEKSGYGEPPDPKKICHDTMVTMQIDRNLLPKVLTDDDVVKEMKKDYGNQGILSPTEEALLCKHITESVKHNYGFGYKNARVLAYELAVINKKSMPESWGKNRQSREKQI